PREAASLLRRHRPVVLICGPSRCVSCTLGNNAITGWTSIWGEVHHSDGGARRPASSVWVRKVLRGREEWTAPGEGACHCRYVRASAARVWQSPPHSMAAYR